jgi:hypothetical protein
LSLRQPTVTNRVKIEDKTKMVILFDIKQTYTQPRENTNILTRITTPMPTVRGCIILAHTTTKPQG